MFSRGNLTKILGVDVRLRFLYFLDLSNGKTGDISLEDEAKFLYFLDLSNGKTSKV